MTRLTLATLAAILALAGTAFAASQTMEPGAGAADRCVGSYDDHPFTVEETGERLALVAHKRHGRTIYAVTENGEVTAKARLIVRKAMIYPTVYYLDAINRGPAALVFAPCGGDG